MPGPMRRAPPARWSKAGAKRWYCITADYAFGHSVQREVTRVVQAAGGQVVGSSVYPFPQTTDFSSFLVTAASLQARCHRALQCRDGHDQLRQAGPGIRPGRAEDPGRRDDRLHRDVYAIGLPTAQGLTLTESYYWDLNDRSRALPTG